MAINPLIVIPTRLAATRLPQKPLADIWGKPMIQHVWEKAVAAQVGPVIVASADQEILDVVNSFGGEGVLTDPALPTGTDRVKSGADLYDPQGKHDLIINIQGDLPTLEPSLVRHVLDPFQNPLVDIATLAAPLENPVELNDINVIKIALSLHEAGPIGRALYFSRHPIPSGSGPYYHHIGLYAYKREGLNRFVSLPMNPLEVQERLEQLRALAHGLRIEVKVVQTEAPFGVDTPADLAKAIQIMRKS
jgi:3-deoxy-manno-octulosonate cytidylyltransferase (CMP-KDO synthetase)